MRGCTRDLPVSEFVLLVVAARGSGFPAAKEKPPILETQFIGDDFIASNAAAVLQVPSAVTPLEFNYLINPNHPDSNRIVVVDQSEMKFDE